MALTAMPVFAGDVVSVEASDATVTSPDVDASSSADAKAIAADLASKATFAVAGTHLVSDARDWTVTGGSSAAADGSQYTYTVKDASDPVFTAKADGTDLESAKVTLNLDVNEGDNGKGTATVVVDLIKDTVTGTLRYTAAQKVAALKAYTEARVAVINAGKISGVSFDKNDNGTTIKNKLGLASADKLAAITDADATTVANKNDENIKVSAATLSISVGTVTDSTTTTTGSIPFTVTYSASTQNTTLDTTTKEPDTTSSLSGTIAKKKAQNDTDYEARIEAAIEAATWTTDDFNVAAGSTTGTMSSTANVGLDKLQKVVLSADNNANANGLSVTPADAGYVTVSRYVAGAHGKDGTATIIFKMSRLDGKSANVVDSFNVTVPVVEGDGQVQEELADAFTTGVKNAETSLKATAVADQDAAVKVIKDAIDARLARTANGKTFAADIDSYEIVVPKDAFKASSTTAADGEIHFYIKVNTGRTSSTDPSKKVTWYFDDTDLIVGSKIYAVGPNSSLDPTMVTKDTPSLIDITSLAQAAEVDATSISLPSTISYNVLTAGKNVTSGGTTTYATGIDLKDYLTINPKDANTYSIRWTNSNTTDYLLSYGSAHNPINAWTIDADENKVAVFPNLTLINDAASTTITAELLDADGNVVAKASTVVTAMEGFEDVQNKSYFAYNAINALSNTIKREDDAGAGAKTYNVNGRTYSPLSVAAGKKISSSPVAGGTGNNKFDPYADVTRAQFVTFLYRNACNEYTFIGSAYDKDPASYDGNNEVL